MATSNTSATATSTNPQGKGQVPFTFSLDTPSVSSGTLNNYLKTVLGEDSSGSIPDLLVAPKDSGVTPRPEPTHHIVPAPVNHTPTTPTSSSTPTTVNHTDILTPGVSREGPSISMTPQRMSNVEGAASAISGQLSTTVGGSSEVIPAPSGHSYVDITEYLNMPQAEAAHKLNIPPSTLSKRWKEAVRSRKWPYRMICKIDKEIMTLLHNVPQGPNAPPLPEEIENALGHLLRKRQEELRPVVIRI